MCNFRSSHDFSMSIVSIQKNILSLSSVSVICFFIRCEYLGKIEGCCLPTQFKNFDKNTLTDQILGYELLATQDSLSSHRHKHQSESLSWVESYKDLRHNWRKALWGKIQQSISRVYNETRKRTLSKYIIMNKVMHQRIFTWENLFLLLPSYPLLFREFVSVSPLFVFSTLLCILFLFHTEALRVFSFLSSSERSERQSTRCMMCLVRELIYKKPFGVSFL